MQFVHQPLTWGFFLVLVPLLIHLINMMRHRRVKWAAMEFLLQSYKKHRKWIWLKQLFLLLMRMAAVALVVAMLAQWVSRGQWLDLLGGKPTHHYVLLDDSYSMSDRLGGASAFEIGLDGGPADRRSHRRCGQSGTQKFTLIRLSRAARSPPNWRRAWITIRSPDFNAQIVDPEFDVTLEAKRNTFQVTELAVGPAPALRLLKELIGLASNENRHGLRGVRFPHRPVGESGRDPRACCRRSDSRRPRFTWSAASANARQNLAVVDVTPANETRAAGVPLFVNAMVKNFGPDTAATSN